MEEFFKYFTPITYWFVIIMWLYIFIFYLKKIWNKRKQDKLLGLLLLVLSIDAFRTLFESIYFGAWYTSLSGLIPIEIFNFLAQPQIVFFPKIINLITAVIVLIILINRWLPSELIQKNKIENLIEKQHSELLEKNKKLNDSTDALREANRELKLAKEKAEVREKYYSNIINNIGDPVFVKDEQSRIILVNDAFCNLFDLERENMIGKTLAEEVPLEEQESFLSIDKEVIETGEESINEESFSVIGKKAKIISTRKTRYIDQNGDKILIGIIRDISERKQSEEELKAQRDLFEVVINTIPIRIFWKDLNSRYQGCNSQFAKDSGMKNPEDVIGKYDDAMVWKKDAEEYRIDDKLVISTGNPKLNNDEEFLNSKGEKVFWMTNKLPLRNSEGKITGILATAENITDKKQAEEALRESEEKLNLIINSSPIGIATTDKLGNFVTTNPAYELMVGYTKEELVGLSFYDVTHPNDRPKNKKLFQDMFSLDTKGFSIEKTYIRKDGEEIMVSIHAIGIRDAEGKVRFATAFVNDITDRKLAEQTISSSHNRYMALFNESPIPLWEEDLTDLVAYLMEINEEGHKDLSTYFDNNPEELMKCAGMVKIIDVNQAALDLHQAKNKDQLIGNLAATFTENSFSIFKEELISIIEGKKIYKSEAEVKTLSGDLKHIYITLKIDYSQPNMVKALLATSDITDRKKAEEALIQSEAQLRTITDNLPVIISQIDKDLKYLFVNKFYYDKSKFESDVVGKNALEVMGKETYNRALPGMKKVLSGEFVSFENKTTHTKNNELIIFETHYIPYVVNGQVESFFVLGMDITERKLAEEALRDSEEKLNALFTSLTEMVVMHELVFNDADEAINYRIIDCNNVFTELTGISKEDAIGKLATEVYQTDLPPYLEEFSKVGLSGEAHEFNTYYKKLDKHLMISVVSPQAGKFATITTDITPMMGIQEIIIAKNKEMENYLYIASHDLRTPLVNIQGFSQRLKTQTDSIKTLVTDNKDEPEIRHQLAAITDENIPKTLNFIFSNIEKMDKLINGLLQLSRTGRLDMDIQKNDMNELFAKILHSLNFQINEINCKIDINTLPNCYGDAELLDQLFTNIINNALNYYDPERSLEITVDAKTIYNKVIYSISDTGKGIAQKHLHKIWDVFYRVDPKSGKPGEGIGLSLVKRIVEKHKGKIWVESEENSGSVFYIELNNRNFTEI